MEPNSWIDVPDNDSGSKAHSKILNRYLWRQSEEEPELIVVFDETSRRVRYKYFGVSKDKFDELYLRTMNPENYRKPIDKWFLRNISESHEYQTFSDFKKQVNDEDKSE